MEEYKGYAVNSGFVYCVMLVVFSAAIGNGHAYLATILTVVFTYLSYNLVAVAAGPASGKTAALSRWGRWFAWLSIASAVVATLLIVVTVFKE